MQETWKCQMMTSSTDTIRRCTICYGSGTIMGGGMIFKDCHECDGIGKVSKAYDDAIEKIQKVSGNISKEEAKNIFNDELEKLNIDKPKRGRPRRMK